MKPLSRVILFVIVLMIGCSGHADLRVRIYEVKEENGQKIETKTTQSYTDNDIRIILENEGDSTRWFAHQLLIQPSGSPYHEKEMIIVDDSGRTVFWKSTDDFLQYMALCGFEEIAGKERKGKTMQYFLRR